MKIRIIIGSFLILLIATNVMVIIKYVSLRTDYKELLRDYEQLNIKSSVGFTGIKNMVFESLTGNIVELPENCDKIRILLFVSPTDCVSCFHVMLMINNIQKKYRDRLDVITFLQEDSEKQAKRSLRGLNMEYSIVFDPYGKKVPGLSCNIKTPFLVILNSGGDVISYSNPYPDKKYEEFIIRIIENV